MTAPFALAHRAVIRVSGPERVGFLQGLLSNDLMAATAETSLYAALLTPQGKLLHDLIVAVHEDALLLEGEAARLPDLLQRLGRYKLRAKIGLEDVSDRFEVLALPDGDPELDLPRRAGASRPHAGGVAMIDPRHSSLGLHLLVPRGALATAGSADGWRRRRLELGIGEGAADFGEGTMLALEANLDHLNGISFTKGCYVGQEVTSRSHRRGLIRRRLTPVRVHGPLPEPGTPVLTDGQEAGEFRAGHDALALALLRTDLIDGAEAPFTAGGIRLTPLPPVWEPNAI